MLPLKQRVPLPCRTYLEETLRLENRFSQQLEQDLAELQTMLGLGRKECQKICDETSSKVYRCAPHLSSMVGALPQSTAACISLSYSQAGASL